MANTHSLDLELSSSQGASITDASQTGLDITGDLTIEAWVQFESTPSAELTIAAKYQTSTNQRAYVFFWNGAAGRLSFVNSDNGTNGSQINSNAFSPTTGVWYHVAIVKSGTTVTFYVDGASHGGGSVAYGTMHNSTTRFTVGFYDGAIPQSFFDGKIDELRVWSEARSGAEISGNYQQELLGTETNLQGYWRFNNDLTDQTSNNNDLTGLNTPTFSTDIPTWPSPGGGNPMFFSGGGLTVG